MLPVAVLAMALCLTSPWLQYLREVWWPRYRHRRGFDGRMVGTAEGHLAVVVEPAPWHLRRRFWRLVYPTTGVGSKALYGAPVVLQAVVTAKLWKPGRPLYDCGTVQRRFRR